MVYKIINTIFSRSKMDLSAAEAHGIATGMLCADEHAENAQWLAELFKDAQPVSNEAKNILIRLFEETGRLLTSDGFEFELLLPEDDNSLTDQVKALTQWCRGFLLGVSFGCSTEEWPDDVREIIKDITEFTKLDTAVEGEEDATAFTEITEYLRSVVVLLRDDLNDLKYKKA